MGINFLHIILMSIIFALIAYIYLYLKSKDKICMNYKDTINKLDVKLVHEMTRGYKQHQLNAINGQLGINDARVITFELETLKRFLFHIEKTTKQNNSNVKNEDLAVNIYYARYPKQETWKKGGLYNRDLGVFLNNAITKQYEDKHTLVFIPAIRNKKGNFMDFDPSHTDTYSTGLRNNERYADSSNTVLPALSVSTKSSNSNNNNGINNTSGQNHGGLYPPYSTSDIHF